MWVILAEESDIAMSGYPHLLSRSVDSDIALVYSRDMNTEELAQVLRDANEELTLYAIGRSVVEAFGSRARLVSEEIIHELGKHDSI